MSNNILTAVYGGFVSKQVIGDVRIGEEAGNESVFVPYYYNVRSNFVAGGWGIKGSASVTSLVNEIDSAGNQKSVSVADVVYTLSEDETGTQFGGTATFTVLIPVGQKTMVGMHLVDKITDNVIYDSGTLTELESGLVLGAMAIQGATPVATSVLPSAT